MRRSLDEDQTLRLCNATCPVKSALCPLARAVVTTASKTMFFDGGESEAFVLFVALNHMRDTNGDPCFAGGQWCN